MPRGGTYPSTIKVGSKTYRFVCRAYAENVYGGKAGRERIKEEARKERDKGYLTKIVEKKGKTHTVFMLYSCPKTKSK